MTSSTSSKTSRVPDGTRRKESKGGNRARPQPVEKVRSGRVNKHHHKASPGRGSTPEVPKAAKDVRQEPQQEFPPCEISDGEDDPYEDAGTDKDCSEGSGSATEEDTPTRLALERRKEAKKKRRAKITTRRLESPRDSIIRGTPNAPQLTSLVFCRTQLAV